MAAANVTLHDSLVLQEPTRGELVSARAGSTTTLAALHGLPLEELHDSPEPGLAGFTWLRAVTLHQTPIALGFPEPLDAALLPPGLRDLRL